MVCRPAAVEALLSEQGVWLYEFGASEIIFPKIRLAGPSDGLALAAVSCHMAAQITGTLDAAGTDACQAFVVASRQPSCNSLTAILSHQGVQRPIWHSSATASSHKAEWISERQDQVVVDARQVLWERAGSHHATLTSPPSLQGLQWPIWQRLDAMMAASS